MKIIKFIKFLKNNQNKQLCIGKFKNELYLLYGIDINEFLGVKISEKDLELIETGSKDIRKLFIYPKSKLFYPCSIKGERIQLKFLSTKDLIKKFLCPQKDFYIKTGE